jgi:hypothetical protein
MLQPRTFLPEEEAENQKIYGTRAIYASIMDMIVNMLAALLILVPVIVLHFIQNSDMRLVAVVLFSFTFTCAMGIFTEAKRGEVFAASAAFVAVQVVYVGSTLNNKD